MNLQHKEDVLQVVSQIDAIERMRTALVENGFQVEYSIHKGGHSAVAWATNLPTALQWALPAGDE